MIGISEQVEWLSLVDISGPFLSASVLEEIFPQGLDKIETPRRQRLRAAYDEWRDAVDEADHDLDELHAVWTRMVIQGALEYEDEVLVPRVSLKGEVIYRAPEYGVEVAPDFAVRGNDGILKLLVAVHPPGISLEKAMPGDRWPASPAERMTTLCRANGVRIGLVTNGEQWMLVNAPVGSTSGYSSWFARLWWQEPVTFKAFVSLIGVRRCFGPIEATLGRLLERSLEFQDEVTDTLGEQVRRAVEVLIQALGRADHDRNGELLRDVTPAELYEAGLTIMMRLVFILCAEERGLLLLGDPVYDQYYAISTLRALLRDDESQHGPEVLERRHDAWSRMLAVFRGVYGGVEHETLRMPALGGSLFDPDRFPFLEGRTKGTSWREAPASPLPIDNRTVLLLLTALQVLEQRGGAQLLSYRALDVEQIGHVYEGLLEYTVVKLPEVTVALIGSQKVRHPTIGLSELESIRTKGTKAASDRLAELTGRSVTAIEKSLERNGEDTDVIRLIQACSGDEVLARSLLPFAGLIRTDSWGSLLVYRAGSFAVARGSARRETGTHYTPRSLTESIVEKTLEPVAYLGPAEGKPRADWKLRTATELLDLKICDPAMGSGAFLVQACRYLAERLVQGWAREEDAGRFVTVDGAIAGSEGERELIPKGLDDRLLVAKRLIAERCLYGVDLNPLAVELAKLSIWLVTLAKGRPFGFLNHNLRCGDSLLGIHRLDQLTRLEMDTRSGSQQPRLFGRSIEAAVEKSIELRKRLREILIRDIRDIEAMAHLDEESHNILKGPSLVADAFIDKVFSSTGNNNSLSASMDSLTLEADRLLRDDGGLGRRLRNAAQEALAEDQPQGKLIRRPLHWPLEFPEVFDRDNPGFDGIVGNPPFLGGKRICNVLGDAYNRYLKRVFEKSKGAADLCTYFFRRAHLLQREHGYVGLLATNSISQGDTREVGLDFLTTHGCTVIAAMPDMPWPGHAGVAVTWIVFVRGAWAGPCELDGIEVAFISPHLESVRHSGTPHKLRIPVERASYGTGILGIGFTVPPDLARQWVKQDKRYAEILFPYINAKDLNTSPEFTYSRFVIDFDDRSEAESSLFPLAYKRASELVKPQRDRLTRQIHESCWWKHWDRRTDLYEEASRFKEVMVVPLVTKYLSFVFLPVGWIYSKELGVLPTDRRDLFAIYQSTFHELWARRNSSTLETRLAYSFSDALRTFPLPGEIFEAAVPDLVHAGRAFEESRRTVCRERKMGLTNIYNRLHDPQESSAEITRLRELLVEMDQVVSNAYGWRDMDLGHGFHDTPQGLRYTISRSAHQQAVDRLLKLNIARYEAENA